MPRTKLKRQTRLQPKKMRTPPVRRHGKRREQSYWQATRTPIASLMLVVPLLVVYELGCLTLGETSNQANVYRSGADAWMRNSLAQLGWQSPWILPASVVLILAGWQVVQRPVWRMPFSIVVAMVAESTVLAVALVGASRLVDALGAYMDSSPPSLLALDRGGGVSQGLPIFFGLLGAGIYEEVLFRLILVPGFFYGQRLLRMPHVIASALAVTGAALLFSLAHHAGSPGEPFTWFAFVFRWLAGLIFGWIFVIRGFGIAVGTHTAYDFLVGWVSGHN